MFAHWKKFVIAALIATAAGTATLAAPDSWAGLDPTSIAGTVTVAFNDSQDATFSVDAGSLLDANQMIRVDYGSVSVGSLLKIKQVVAPEGITVTLSDSSLSTTDGTAMLNLEFSVTNNAFVTAASTPVQVVLENVETGETSTVTLIVQAS
jgi:hypothetical protein